MEEGLPQTEAFVSLTNLDEENVFLALFAKTISNAKLVAKVNRLAFDDVIDNLDIGFTFTECGGTRSIYLYQDIEKTDIDGHLLEIASSCIIEKTTKKLSNNIEEVEIYETV